MQINLEAAIVHQDIAAIYYDHAMRVMRDAEKRYVQSDRERLMVHARRHQRDGAYYSKLARRNMGLEPDYDGDIYLSR